MTGQELDASGARVLDNQWMQTLVRPWAILGREPFATHLKAAPDEDVQMFGPRTSTSSS